MSDYTYQDILRMQEEAKARVMEMRRRSRYVAEDFSPPAPPPEALPEPPRQGPPDHARAIRMPVDLPRETPRTKEADGGGEVAQPGEASPRREGEGPPPRGGTPSRDAVPAAKSAARGSFGLPAALRGWFGSLGEEEAEKMLILALCLLLSQENGDEGLLLSLLYLLT